MQPPVCYRYIVDIIRTIQYSQLNSKPCCVFGLYTPPRTMKKEVFEAFVFEGPNHILSVVCNVSICNIVK